MAERDISNPPNLHPLHILDHPGYDDLATFLKSPGETARHLAARGKRHAANERHRRDQAFRRAMVDAMKHPRDRHITPPRRNPLYSQALGRDGLNDGNQGRTLQGIPATSSIIAGAQPYTGMGPGIP